MVEIGQMARQILSTVGLAFEKDYAYADCMWINSLNHCQQYLLDIDTPILVKENLIRLLLQIDDGEELINDWLNDYKSIKEGNPAFTYAYAKALLTICPIIIEKQKELNEELDADNK